MMMRHNERKRLPEEFIECLETEKRTLFLRKICSRLQY